MSGLVTFAMVIGVGGVILLALGPVFFIVYMLGKVAPGMRVLPDALYAPRQRWVIWSIDHSGWTPPVRTGTPWRLRWMAELSAWWSEPEDMGIEHRVVREGQWP